MVGLNLAQILRDFIANSKLLKEDAEYKRICELVSLIEDKIKEYPWIELRDGTTYDKTFIPGTFKAKSYKERLIELLDHSILNTTGSSQETYRLFRSIAISLTDHGKDL